MESVEELWRRNQQRKQDGFPPKIRFRKTLVSPDKVIVVPYVREEHLVHGDFEPKNMATQFLGWSEEPDIDEGTGHGDGDVGDVVDHIPIGDGGDGEGDDDGDGAGNWPGPGTGGDEATGEDRFEEEAYEVGNKLTERLKLPNIKEKIKKIPSDEYTYELTDRHKRSGQVLDRGQTLRNIQRTNLVLGTITLDDLDPANMVVDPNDRVYRVLSREIIWLSQAVVFFVRDYSGSMWGSPTQALVAQQLMIYGWLLSQYGRKRVIPRFIVHHHAAQEVSAREYFTAIAWGGTFIASAYKKVNEIVQGENLQRDYDIYVFQGSDGDDGDSEGMYAVPEMKTILSYVSRMGVVLFKHPYWAAVSEDTQFERYVKEAKIHERRDVFRMHVIPNYWHITDQQNEEALKALIAQD